MTVYENDLSVFGHLELTEVSNIFIAYKEGRITKLANDYFDFSTIKICFNDNSGNVFLSDSEYNTIMLSDGILDLWIYTPYYGFEGSLNELVLDKLDDILDKENYLDEIDYLYNHKEYFDDKMVKKWNNLLNHKIKNSLDKELEQYLIK